jgi:hypothetical protein
MANGQSNRSAANKAIDDFRVSGRWAYAFVEQMFAAMPVSDARKLTKEFAKVIKADGEDAQQKGIAFENGLPGNPDKDAHLKASTRPYARDREFAKSLPESLRRQFYATVREDKEFDYRWGQGRVQHERTMKQLDAILADPVQADAFYHRSADNAHLRDPIMFPKFPISFSSDF